MNGIRGDATRWTGGVRPAEESRCGPRYFYSDRRGWDNPRYGLPLMELSKLPAHRATRAAALSFDKPLFISASMQAAACILAPAENDRDRLRSDNLTV